MIKNKILMYSPLLASAKLALKQGNNDVAIAKVKEFAHNMSQFYEKGDTSYDALRCAYVGTSNASLILGDVGDFEALDYAEMAVDMSYKMYDNKGSANDAIAIVSASTALLTIIIQECSSGVFLFCGNRYIDTNDIRDKARKMAHKLQEKFPDNNEVVKIISSFDTVDDEYKGAIAKVKKYAHNVSQFYGSGDASYDATRSAYISAYYACQILAKIRNSEALYYAEKAVDLSYKMLDKNGTTNDAIAVVSASTTLLTILFQWDRSSWKIDKIRDKARDIAQKLRTCFPNDKEVLDTINGFDVIDTEFRNEEEKFKIQANSFMDNMMSQVVEMSKNWQDYSQQIEQEKEQQKKKGRQERQFNIIPIVVALVVIIALCCLYFYSIK